MVSSLELKKSIATVKRLFKTFIIAVNNGDIILNDNQKVILKKLIRIYNNKDDYQVELVRNMHIQFTTQELKSNPLWLTYVLEHAQFVDLLVRATNENPELEGKLYVNK